MGCELCVLSGCGPLCTEPSQPLSCEKQSLGSVSFILVFVGPCWACQLCRTSVCFWASPTTFTWEEVRQASSDTYLADGCSTSDSLEAWSHSSTGAPVQDSHLQSSELMCMCVVAQSCLTLCDPRNCSPPVFSVHSFFSGKNTGVGCHFLISSSRGSSRPRDQTRISSVSCIAGGFFTHCAIREPQSKLIHEG